ncbi:MAG: DUF2628 domain-containing protein [Holosporales bacterium]|jgi:hypothetical protein|nr:DUF2628 domain-containing protein [Holosporales bacterium]
MRKENKQVNECIDHPISEMNGMVKIAGRPYGNSSLLKKMFCADEYYYARQFQRIRKKGGFALSWNWAALFGAGVWMVYHKMYLAYSAFYALDCILQLLFDTFLSYVVPNFNRYDTILSIVYVVHHFIVMGCIGNVLLYYAAKRKYKVGYAFSTRIRSTNRASLCLLLFLGFIASMAGLFMALNQAGCDNVLQGKIQVENKARTRTKITRETQDDMDKQGTSTLKSQQQPCPTISMTAGLLTARGMIVHSIFVLILLGVAIKDYTGARRAKRVYTQRFTYT